MCGIPLDGPHWSLRQVNQLLFLRELKRTGRFGPKRRAAEPARLTLNSSGRDGESLLPSSMPPPKRRRASSRRRFGRSSCSARCASGPRAVGTWVPSAPMRDPSSPSSPTSARPPRPSAAASCTASRPDAMIIDISHQVPRYSIREGAGTLVFALPYMPVGDPRGGRRPGRRHGRLPVAIRRARGDILIGPDNGLLTPAAERARRDRRGARPREPRPDAAGHHVELPRPGHLLADRRAPRDAARRYETVGPDCPDRLARPASESPRRRSATACSSSVIVRILIFGNLTFAGTPADLEARDRPADARPAAGSSSSRPTTAPRRSTERTVWEQTFGRVPLGASLLYGGLGGPPRARRQPGQMPRPRLGLALDRPGPHPPGLSRMTGA